MTTHNGNVAVDIFENQANGKLSRLPLARVLFLTYDRNNPEESKKLMQMFGARAAPNDAEALKDKCHATWYYREIIDRAEEQGMIDYCDPFVAKWFGGAGNVPWVLPRPENTTVERLKSWKEALDYVTTRVCQSVKKNKEQFLTEQRYSYGEVPAQLRNLINSNFKAEVNSRYNSPATSPYKK